MQATALRSLLRSTHRFGSTGCTGRLLRGPAERGMCPLCSRNGGPPGDQCRQAAGEDAVVLGGPGHPNTLPRVSGGSALKRPDGATEARNCRRHDLQSSRSPCRGAELIVHLPVSPADLCLLGNCPPAQKWGICAASQRRATLWCIVYRLAVPSTSSLSVADRLDSFRRARQTAKGAQPGQTGRLTSDSSA